MQCDFPFHFSSSGNGLARLAAIASPMSLALPILRPLLISPPPLLSEMGDSRGRTHVSPAFATPARPGLKNGKKNSQAEKTRKDLMKTRSGKRKLVLC